MTKNALQHLQHCRTWKSAFAAFANILQYFAILCIKYFVILLSFEYFALMLLQHCCTWNIERSSYEMAASANSSKDLSIIAAAPHVETCSANDSMSH